MLSSGVGEAELRLFGAQVSRPQRAQQLWQGLVAQSWLQTSSKESIRNLCNFLCNLNSAAGAGTEEPEAICSPEQRVTAGSGGDREFSGQFQHH